jgi:hypothetical protein
MNNIVMIQLKDICYYEDSYEFEPIFVIKEENFEEKYSKLVEVCKNYEDYQEVEDFIYDNFKRIDVERREIEV